MNANSPQATLRRCIYTAATGLENVPGLDKAARYVQRRYESDPLFFAIEMMLSLFCVYFMTAQRRRSKESDNVRLTEKVGSPMIPGAAITYSKTGD